MKKNHFMNISLPPSFLALLVLLVLGTPRVKGQQFARVEERGVLSPAALTSAKEGTVTDDAKNRVSESSVEVNWLTFEEAVEKAKKNPKKIFVDVYTDWCGWCKVMDKKTFSEEGIARYLNEHFYPVKLDGEYEGDIEFKGATFKFVPSGRKGYHQLAAALLQNRLSYPTVVFLDEEFNVIQPLPGYQKVPEFDRVIKFIGGNHFKEKSWKEFNKSYKSPYEG